MMSVSRRMRWTEYVKYTGMIRNAHKICVGKTERDHLGDLGVDGRILLG
jgi:hypothetical protein